MRIRRTLLVVPLAVAALAGCGGSDDGSGGSSSNSPAAVAPQKPASLVAEVGKNDGFQISLTDDKGTPIRNLVAGTYTVEFKDESAIHNFAFNGPGVTDETTVPEKVTKTMKITFAPGEFSFVCDPHAGRMKGGFTVT